jgi:Bacteriocin-protection, YdeI or OmpD-Associated/Domain of unknown function (DU1801)
MEAVMAKKSAAGEFSREVDAYIAKAAPFAQPVLEHLRQIIHEGAQGVVEGLKWSMPFFDYEGPDGKRVILANMAAFKAHCSFGLWGAELAREMRADGVVAGGSMGSFGKITSIKDLPPKKQLLGYVKEAARKIGVGERTKAWTRTKVVKAEVPVPEALVAALKKNKVAAKAFEGMSPSCRKEYSEWIAEAKREETRDKRVVQAVEWIAEGKNRNWKYESK